MKDIEKLKRVRDLSYQNDDCYSEIISIIENFLLEKLTLIQSEIENM